MSTTSYKDEDLTDQVCGLAANLYARGPDALLPELRRQNLRGSFLECR
jgi:hypothetical protein